MGDKFCSTFISSISLTLELSGSNSVQIPLHLPKSYCICYTAFTPGRGGDSLIKVGTDVRARVLGGKFLKYQGKFF